MENPFQILSCIRDPDLSLLDRIESLFDVGCPIHHAHEDQIPIIVPLLELKRSHGSAGVVAGLDSLSELSLQILDLSGSEPDVTDDLD